MAKVWDHCTSCDKPLEPSEKENWRQCTRCRLTSISINCFLAFFTLAIWIFFIRSGKINGKSISSVLGLTFDIVGTWFLATGYIDIMMRAASGWDSGSIIGKYLKRNFLKLNLGLLFMGIGFSLQALSCVLQ